VEVVLRLGGVEGALGPVGVVAGAFHRKLCAPATPLMPAGDLAGGRQDQGDLPGVSASSGGPAAAASTRDAAPALVPVALLGAESQVYSSMTVA
jgi:hypothetical protein